jgi:hypothetical protein
LSTSVVAGTDVIYPFAVRVAAPCDRGQSSRPMAELSRGRHLEMTWVERERMILLPDRKNGTTTARRLQRDVRRQLSDLLQR